ncbi:unnamed protein product [Heterobilharzia americana]|nr:unnamed protein product [Heterobilharzia americana]
MKLLEQVNLECLSSQLSSASKRFKIDARLESYSCKMVSEEKRQFRELVSRLHGAESHESPTLYLGSSQTLRDLHELTGQVIDPQTFRMSIIQDQSPTLFWAYYDFLTARSDEFCLEPELWLVKHYISRFCSIYVDKYEDIAPQLWTVIGEEIIPDQCRIYSYRPDHLSDPYSSGCLASFNYFFHNRLLRRILFFSLRVLNDSLVEGENELEESDLY